MANRDRADVQSGLDDLLGSVIKSDQRTAGRARTAPDIGVEEKPSPLDYDSMTSHTVITDTGVTAARNYDNKTNKQADNDADTPTLSCDSDALTAIAPKRRGPKSITPGHSQIEKRREEAATMAEATTMTVTLRIPAALNEWLDEYVHRSWPTKVKKQELVIEALQLLFVRRGRPGEDILETELLPEKRK